MINDESSEEEAAISIQSSPAPKKVKFKKMNTQPKHQKVHQTRSRSKNNINAIQVDNMHTPLPPTPNTVTEALAATNPHREQWREAINKEIDEILRREVFEQVPIEENVS